MPIGLGAVGEPPAASAAPHAAAPADTEETAMEDLLRRERAALARAADWRRALRTRAQWLCGARWPDVPRVRGWRLTGMLLAFDAHQMHAVRPRLWQAAARRGLAYGHVGPQQVVVLRDAVLVRQLLSPVGEAQAVRVTEAGHGPFDVASRILGNNVFTSHGEVWRARRGVVSGALFDLAALRARQDVSGEPTEATVGDILARPGPVHWSDTHARFTLEAVGRAAFACPDLGDHAARIQGVLADAIELAQDYRHALHHAHTARPTGRSTQVPGGAGAPHRAHRRQRQGPAPHRAPGGRRREGAPGLRCGRRAGGDPSSDQPRDHRQPPDLVGPRAVKQRPPSSRSGVTFRVRDPGPSRTRAPEGVKK